MNKDFWGEVKGFGNFYLEEELVVGAETILFVCTDENGKRFLFMTYDSYEGIYVFTAVSDEILIAMLEGKIPIERVYRSAAKIYTTLWKEKIYISEEHDAINFTSEKLPDRNLFYTIHSEYIQDYIKSIRRIRMVDDSYMPFMKEESSCGNLFDTSYILEKEENSFDSDSMVLREIGNYTSIQLDIINNTAA